VSTALALEAGDLNPCHGSDILPYGILLPVAPAKAIYTL